MLGLGTLFAPSRAALLNSSVVLSREIPVAETDKKKRAERAIKEAYWKAFRQATAMLMTGPKATQPRTSTVHRMMRLLAAGGPSIRGALLQVRRPGEQKLSLLHPTKGFRGG